jgi:hypothetical protein
MTIESIVNMYNAEVSALNAEWRVLNSRRKELEARIEGLGLGLIYEVDKIEVAEANFISRNPSLTLSIVAILAFGLGMLVG